MKKAQVTIKDIAKGLGVSISTVSRALRDHPDIGHETKERVRKLASELDYHPDGLAQGLKKMRTRTIGVIVPEIKHDFFSSAVDGIEDVTYKAGYTIFVSKSNESYEREVLNTRAMVSNRVAGLLVSISQTTQNGNHFRSLQRRNIPIVFFDRLCEDIEANKVQVDDRQGAFRAVEHLIESGYKRIAHIAGPEHLSIANERLAGYREALRKYDMPFKEEWVIRSGLHEEDGILSFDKLLQLEPRPDAIFAINDPVAVGALISIKEKKLRVPEDIALVGFSDNSITSLVTPALTTVAQPAYEVGASAAKLLLEEIENGKGDSFFTRTVTLKTKLIIREST